MVYTGGDRQGVDLEHMKAALEENQLGDLGREGREQKAAGVTRPQVGEAVGNGDGQIET